MNVVLYTDDMEPITVINLPPEAVRFAREGYYRVPVIEPPTYLDVTEPLPTESTLKIVDVWCERFIRKGKEHLFFFTKDEEFALLLRGDFLPGQRRELMERERNAFARGLLYAIQRGM